QCLAVVEAFSAGDGAALGAGLQSLGLIDAAHGQTALQVGQTALGPLGQSAPARLDVQAVADCLPRLDSVEEQAVSLLVGGRLEPGDLYPARGIGQCFSLIARFGAEASWPELVAAALRESWAP
ncbi:MAG: hypothetical protein J2O48_12185, partial [Solirubrobacterales bacterium]|nr:hypothetical protein [Solirubrobacterales bacterium]